jgi:non-canonical purine NTP pyrophosphatase (RdgB/HAM1 family)
MQLHFLTGNKFKVETAKLALSPFDIEVVPVTLNIPEIQADTNVEIARHSVLVATKMLGKPVMREDHGFYLTAFPGWPGPYMAHTEKIIAPEDTLQLLHGKDRSGYFEMALAYATPEGGLIEFSYRLPTTIAETTRPGSKDFGWDSIIRLGDENRTLSEYPPEERYQFFTQNYIQLARKLLSL